ncbi:hypothetical protein D3C84_1281060 [compost metagenome]
MKGELGLLRFFQEEQTSISCFIFEYLVCAERDQLAEKLVVCKEFSQTPTCTYFSEF